MTEQELRMYEQIRNVPRDKSLAAARAAMVHASEHRFKAENAARAESIARLNPVHDAMRAAMAKSADFRSVQDAALAARRRPQRTELARPFVPAAPRHPRLKLGSFHLVDTAPFHALTWQSVNVFGGPSYSNLPQPAADGQTGDMSFNIAGGGYNFDNESVMSCWSAIGQTYVMPEGLQKTETGGAFLHFSASPSFNWAVSWGSWLWRLASGNIWIGQVVNRFDQSWALLDTPVSYQTSLQNWYDHNFNDAEFPTGNTTAFGLSAPAFVQPGFFYTCWVWIGASVYGDEIDSGSSFSTATMNANVSTLVFDTF